MRHAEGPLAGAGGAALTIVLPLLPGQSEPWRRFVQELQGSRRLNFEAACRRWGIRTLALWLASARAGDLVVVQVVLAGDLADGDERFARSQEPFDLWIAERARALHGVDLRRGIARYRAELLAMWPEHTRATAGGLLMPCGQRRPLEQWQAVPPVIHEGIIAREDDAQRR